MADQISIAEIRSKFPMYGDMNDDQLVSEIRKKYYADIPITEFTKRIQYTAPNPTEGMSSGQLLMAGAGKAIADLGRGAGQFLGLVNREDVVESRRLDKPLMDTTAGTTGNVAGSLAMLAPTALIPGANTVAGAGAIGAVTGALQPSVSDSEALLNTGLGAVGGAAGQKIGNRLAQFAQGTRQTPGQQQAARDGLDLGMRLTPGQATGSKSLQKIEAALESNPMTSRPFDLLRESNQRVVNSAAAKAIGEKADNLSSEVLGRANERLGAVFEKVADSTPVPMDPMRVGSRLSQILDDTEGLIGGNSSLADNPLFKRLDAFVNEAGGATREQLRNLSSKMGKAAYNNMTSAQGDRELGKAMYALKDIVDSEVLSTLSGKAAKEFGDAMGQYKALMQITGRVGVVNPASGDVSAKSLGNLLQQRDRQGYLFGNNNSDMYNAARFAKAFPEVVGNSGTATRSMGATDWLLSLPMNVASHAYLSKPSQALLGGTHGGTGAVAGLLGTPTVALPGGTSLGLGMSSLLQPYLGQ